MEKLRLNTAIFCTVGDTTGLKQDMGRNVYAEGSLIPGFAGEKGGGQGGGGDLADEQQFSSATCDMRKKG